MKKIIVIAALAIATLASCTKEEKISSASDSPISFNTAVGKAQTKALINQSKYPTDASFGTFAYYKGTSGSSQQLYINNNEVKNENTSTSGTAWTTKTKYYWPKTGSLSFFSYSPYSINTKVSCLPETGIKISDYNVDDNQTIDVMVADPEKNLSGNVDDTGAGKSGYTGVPTVFHHVLSQIVAFNFTNKYYNDPNTHKPIDGAKRFTIKNITITQIYSKGNFQELGITQSIIQRWTPSTADTTHHTLYNDEKGTTIAGTSVTITPTNNETSATSKDGYLLVLPQTLTGNKEKSTGSQIKITYYIETYCNGNWVEENPIRVSSYLTGTWAENKKISYNISFNLDNDQIYWAPSVETWDTPNSGKIPL